LTYLITESNVIRGFVSYDDLNDDWVGSEDINVQPAILYEQHPVLGSAMVTAANFFGVRVSKSQ
jgi:hypothetical protein